MQSKKEDISLPPNRRESLAITLKKAKKATPAGKINRHLHVGKKNTNHVETGTGKKVREQMEKEQ